MKKNDSRQGLLFEFIGGATIVPSERKPKEGLPLSNPKSEKPKHETINRIEDPSQVEKKLHYTLKENHYSLEEVRTTPTSEVLEILIDLKNKKEVTDDQVKTLAEFEGFGANANKLYKNIDKIKEITNDNTLISTETSSLDAYYTPNKISKLMWELAKKASFTGGKVLEPSVGVGSFFKTMPVSLQNNTNLTGIEVETISYTIASILYPNSKIINAKYQNVLLSKQDLIIGNPPYGSHKVKNNNKSLSIHNYFLEQSIHNLKKGGLLIMVVTNSFLDSKDEKTRKAISQDANLLGAFRLPNNSFKGASVTTDIVIFEKKLEYTDNDHSKSEKQPNWVKSSTNKEDGILINNYYQDNPEHMLGDWGNHGKRRGLIIPGLIESNKTNLDKVLEFFNPTTRTRPNNYTENFLTAKLDIKLDKKCREYDVFELFHHDNKVYFKEPYFDGLDRHSKVNLNAKQTKIVIDLIGLKETVNKLINQQLKLEDDEKIKKTRKLLNSQYDNFVDRYDRISKYKKLFNKDIYSSTVFALERLIDIPEEGGKKIVLKSEIFDKQTHKPILPPSTFKNNESLFDYSLVQNGGNVDFEFISELVKHTKSATELESIFYEENLLLYDDKNVPVERLDYLSGDVVKKAKDVKKTLKTLTSEDPIFQRLSKSLRELEKAKPLKIPIDEVYITGGASWIPLNIKREFVKTVFRGEEIYFYIDAKNQSHEIKITKSYFDEKYYTLKKDLSAMLGHYFNGTTPTVFDTIDKKRVFNEEATAEAKEKLEVIKEAFIDYIYNSKHLERLESIYNDTFNSNVKREYSDNYELKDFISEDVIALRPHQKAGINRGVRNQSVLFDHAVGSGKTFTTIGTLVEAKKRGLIKKPVVTVLKSSVSDWVSSTLLLYPNAKLLYPHKEIFNKKDREEFFSRMTYGDYDLIILPHSQFEKISVSRRVKVHLMNQEINLYKQSIVQKSKVYRPCNREIKILERLKGKLEDFNKKSKDYGFSFERIGIDAIAVDESHIFKNLGFISKLHGVLGLGNPSGSTRARDMMMKINILKESGGKVIFATGTPISNSIVEMYTLQRYLDSDGLKDKGINALDDWIKIFSNITTDYEIGADNKYKLTTRLKAFNNLPELKAMYQKFCDHVKISEIDLKLPKEKLPEETNIVVEATESQKEINKTIVERLQNTSRHDPAIKVYSDARKLALDQRILDPSLPPSNRCLACVDKVIQIYNETSQYRGTQLIFTDMSVSKKHKNKELEAYLKLQQEAEDGSEEARKILTEYNELEVEDLFSKSDFSLSDDIRKRLNEKGIPEEQMAFINDYATTEQKKELYRQVNNGGVRVLFGSTSKLGTGLNVQNRLCAIHNLDIPYKPSDLEQRRGRIIRQGNKLAETVEGFAVGVYRYTCKNTSDALSWQRLETKQKFIQSLTEKNIDSDSRSVVSEDQNIGYAELKAITTGNPLILKEIKLAHEVDSLRKKIKRQEQKRIISASTIISLEKIVTNFKENLDSFFEIEKRHIQIKAKEGDISIKYLLGDEALTNYLKLKVSSLRGSREQVPIAKIDNETTIYVSIIIDRVNFVVECQKFKKINTQALGDFQAMGVLAIKNRCKKLQDHLCRAGTDAQKIIKENIEKIKHLKASNNEEALVLDKDRLEKITAEHNVLLESLKEEYSEEKKTNDMFM